MNSIWLVIKTVMVEAAMDGEGGGKEEWTNGRKKEEVSKSALADEEALGNGTVSLGFTSPY